MLRVLALLCLLTPPAIACPRALPGIEVVADTGGTITPDGGVIVTIKEDIYPREATPSLSLRANGAALEMTQIGIAYGLSIMRPKVQVKTLDVMRGTKVLSSVVVASQPALSAPKLVRVRSTAARGSTTPAPRPMYPPTVQSTIEVGQATPAGTYALVIYKLDGNDARSVAYGTPDAKRVLTLSTGGKQCRGGFESLYPGERIAVAWLDVHGRLSPRSAAVTVGTAP